MMINRRKGLMQKPKECHLEYEGKTPEQDIIADTLNVPFQPVRTFPANTNINNNWHNMLIFGDNLQALKHLLKIKKEGKLKNPDGSDGVKLVYIDPPFGTGDQYDASGDKPAYSAKLMGAGYLESLRKRLVLLREILTEDGSIYVRIDYHFGHYLKVLMDEIFEKNNFQNEIIVKRGKVQFGSLDKYTVATDSLYCYSAGKKHVFNKFRRERYEHEPKTTNMILRGERNPRERIFTDEHGDRHQLLPPPNTHFKFIQKKIDEMTEKKLITLKQSRRGQDSGFMELIGSTWQKTALTPSYVLDMPKAIDTNWTDISGYSQNWDYPTENSEQLLERVIFTSSNPGDIILDCFAGSGTTGAVAEKLKRRWIMVDVGKLSMYVIQKRLMSLKVEIGNTGKDLRPQPFVLYNAGLYNYDLINKMGEQDYKKFCLELFQVEPDKHQINGFQMDGLRDGAPTHIFTEKYLTQEFIESLHKTVGSSLTKKMFIISPSQSVKFFEDYLERDGVKYYVLRIPYSIIDEIEKREFTPIQQPDCAAELNDIVDAVGFDFIEAPEVDCKYSIETPKDKLTAHAQITIKKFKSNQRSKKEKTIPDEEALSAVLVDRDYNGDYFRLTDKFFKCDIKNNVIKIPADLGKKIAIIYTDIYGNEKFDVVDSKVFNK